MLASGAGTNLQALLDRVHGRDGVELVAVASDKPTRGRWSERAAPGSPTAVFARERFADRAARDRAMADWLRERGVELVVLAGYMQLLEPRSSSAAFPERGDQRPPGAAAGVPGLGAVEQALDYGVKVFGVTVHFVDDGVDTGPVILQRAVELPDARDADEVLARAARDRARAAAGGGAADRPRGGQLRPGQPAAGRRRAR